MLCLYNKRTLSKHVTEGRTGPRCSLSCAPSSLLKISSITVRQTHPLQESMVNNFWNSIDIYVDYWSMHTAWVANTPLHHWVWWLQLLSPKWWRDGRTGLVSRVHWADSGTNFASKPLCICRLCDLRKACQAWWFLEPLSRKYMMFTKPSLRTVAQSCYFLKSTVPWFWQNMSREFNNYGFWSVLSWLNWMQLDRAKKMRC